MGFTEKITRRRVAVCDGCGLEEDAVSDGRELYAPRGWSELRTGEIVCSSRCRGLVEARKRGEGRAAVAVRRDHR
jgi:hypothetical protein